jgi:uncharacterized repeat protein (TIGR01451 family)
LFAAPGDVIERFSADWESDGWGLAYDSLKDRMLVYHDKPIQHLWQVGVDAPHTASQFPLQNFAEAIENLTGGTVLPGSGDIYAVEWYDNSHGPTIARYDTGGDLQAFWRVNANFPGGGCSGGSLQELNDLARDPDNPGHYLVTPYHGGNFLYRVNLGDTSGGPLVPSQCTLVETISLSNLDPYFGHVLAIEYDPIYEGYWVTGIRSPHVVLLDKNFEVVRSFTVDQLVYDHLLGISPMNNVAAGEPYELWLKQYTTDDVVVVESGAVNNAEADIQVAKDDGIDKYFPGQTIPYAVTVTNAGPDAAQDVVIVDNAPSTTTITGWECRGTGGAVCPSDSGTGDLNETVPLLPEGATLTYIVNLSATSLGGDLTNTATASSTVTADTDSSNNSASDTDTSFGGFAGVTKTDGRLTYTPGEIIEYVIVVANRSGSDITNSFSIEDTAPPRTSVYYWTCTDSNGNVCGDGFDDIDQAYTGLANNTALFIVLQLQVDADRTGLLTNTVTLTGDAVTAGDFNVTSFSDTDARTVFSDLAVTKDDGQDTYLPGGSTTYTITVTNNGPSYSTNVNITDTAPDGTTIGNWSCSPAVLCPNASGTGDIDETVPIMIPGQTLTYTVPLTISSSFAEGKEQLGDLVNGAAVTGDGEDPIQTNNSATDANESASADLSVTKTDGNTTYTPGGSTTYTVTVHNAGPDDAVNVNITDTAPADGTISGWTCTASGGAVCPNASGSGDIAETATILPANGELVYSLDMDIDAGASGTFINTASVDSDTPDPDEDNNSATDADSSVAAIPALTPPGFTLALLLLALTGLMVIGRRRMEN